MMLARIVLGVIDAEYNGMSSLVAGAVTIAFLAPASDERALARRQ